MLLTLGLTPALQRVMVFDRYLPGEVNRAREVHTCAAGKAINAARAAKLLDPEADVITFRPRPVVFEIEFGNALVTTGVVDAIRRLEESLEPGQPMRTCVTVIDRSAGTVTELVEESSRVSDACLRELLQALRGVEAPDVVVAAGSLSPGAPDDFYAQAIDATPSAKWVIDAKGPALLAALASGRGAGRIAKLNADELKQTAHTPDIPRAIRSLHDSGATGVIVTDGSKQIFASDGTRLERFTPPRVHVLNTTGCGDCLPGTFAMSLDHGDDFFTAVRTGIAASAASAETILPSVFDPARRKELLASI